MTAHPAPPDSLDAHDGASVVIKLGGSLLGLADLRSRLNELIGVIPNSRRLLVVGGGAAADAVREWQQIHDLSDEQAHHLAIAAMSLNARMVCDVLDGGAAVGSGDELRHAWGDGRTAVALDSLIDEFDLIDPLPRTWDVTADSIAAWTAKHIAAQELWLVKSLDAPASCADAQRRGLVDAAFADFAGPLPVVRWVNLRAPRPGPQLWLSH